MSVASITRSMKLSNVVGGLGMTSAAGQQQNQSASLPIVATSICVFSTQELVLDRVAWQLWLAGFTVDQAYVRVIHRNRQLEMTGSSIVKNYITSQYRNFEMLENYLHRPKLLFSQLIFPLSIETKQFLIDSYYRFDPKVLRELLGKKLSSRAMRKELEDAHAKSGVPLQGCRRMFDNLKRIMKRCEDLDGNIFRIIQGDFLLQNDLAGQYSHVIFINHYRLDTTKKKLSQISFGDIEYLGSVIMDHFTVPSSSAIDDIDTGLSQDARDLKALLVNQKEALDEFRGRVISFLHNRASDQDNTKIIPADTAASSPKTDRPSISASATHQVYRGMSEKLTPTLFKLLLRGTFSVASGLGYNKELRDIFSLLIEKLVEPCAGAGWGKQEVNIFFQEVLGSGVAFENVEFLPPHHRKRYVAGFMRLSKALGLAVARLI